MIASKFVGNRYARLVPGKVRNGPVGPAKTELGPAADFSLHENACATFKGSCVIFVRC